MAEAGGQLRRADAPAMVRSLERRGISHVFGLPGGAAVPRCNVPKDCSATPLGRHGVGDVVRTGKVLRARGEEVA